MQANGAAKAEEAKPEGHANGSKADVEMKDAAEPSESTSADTDRYKGQLTGAMPPVTSPYAMSLDFCSRSAGYFFARPSVVLACVICWLADCRQHALKCRYPHVQGVMS